MPLTRTDLSPADLARVQAVTQPAVQFVKPESFEELPGGAATTRKRVNADIFSQSSANISFEEESTFKLGNALFRKNWVSAPSSTQASDGLGPLFNARACQNCHLKDGRGHPPEGSEESASMLFRLARTPMTEAERARLADKRQLVLPDPTYGAQLQELAVPGLKGEGRVAISYR
ncbi:MAG: thiol oxidoreductase, partial [Methylobacterium mesophilicum]|nr:thiol oxidoreductase [Methylobacterium mesophilicum]